MRINILSYHQQLNCGTPYHMMLFIRKQLTTFRINYSPILLICNLIMHFWYVQLYSICRPVHYKHIIIIIIIIKITGQKDLLQHTVLPCSWYLSSCQILFTNLRKKSEFGLKLCPESNSAPSLCQRQFYFCSEARNRTVHASVHAKTGHLDSVEWNGGLEWSTVVLNPLSGLVNLRITCICLKSV